MSNTSPIFLSDIWEPSPINDYKIHFARWNQHAQPLDVFVRDFGEWQTWQEYRAGRDDFNRARIFSLMQEYRSEDEWVFGGIWIVLDRLPDRYIVELADELRPLIGRLRLQSNYKDRATRCRMESYFDTFRVASIDRQRYSGRAFPGLASLTVSLAEFREIARRNQADWHGPLVNLKGVYLLRDRNEGKIYVGSAYGNEGIWSRWSAYADSGHGGNAGTVDRFGDDPIAYGIENVDMSLLEPILPSASNEEVFAREEHWKLALGSRDNGNLNRN